MIMNKDYKTAPEMKILSDRYWSIKMLFESANNGDFKAKELIRSSFTVKEAQQMAEFVADCEATGVQLIGRTKN